MMNDTTYKVISETEWDEKYFAWHKDQTLPNPSYEFSFHADIADTVVGWADDIEEKLASNTPFSYAVKYDPINNQVTLTNLVGEA